MLAIDGTGSNGDPRDEFHMGEKLVRVSTIKSVVINKHLACIESNKKEAHSTSEEVE